MTNQHVTFILGDLFKSDTQALVNPVNCVGVTGKGLAKQFKQRYPAVFAEYRAACQAGELKIGGMPQVCINAAQPGPRYVINFPTKNHWRDQSDMENIARSLYGLVHALNKHMIKSVAIPALGCGLGELEWNEVQQYIVATANHTRTVRWEVFEPIEGRTALQFKADFESQTADDKTVCDVAEQVGAYLKTALMGDVNIEREIIHNQDRQKERTRWCIRIPSLARVQNPGPYNMEWTGEMTPQNQCVRIEKMTNDVVNHIIDNGGLHRPIPPPALPYDVELPIFRQ